MELKCVTCEYSAHCWLLILSEKSHLLRCTSHTIHSLVHRIKLLSVRKKTPSHVSPNATDTNFINFSIQNKLDIEKACCFLSLKLIFYRQ